MGKKDKRVDEYIARAADFAQPVLKHFRALVHKTCPEVEEKWKWSFPHFDYHGGPLAHMAAFKQHCAIGFWKASLMKNNEDMMVAAKSESAMGHFGKITSLKELPKDSVLVKTIHEGMKLNELGVKIPVRKTKTAEIETPEDLEKSLRKNAAAKKVWTEFSPGKRKEYNQWITEAKTVATRQSRIKSAVEWISEGKVRNWKYIKNQRP